jgi:hypothetical protein
VRNFRIVETALNLHYLHKLAAAKKSTKLAVTAGIAVILLFLVGVTLVFLDPIWLSRITKFQTLLAGLLAIVAAGIAFCGTVRAANIQAQAGRDRDRQERLAARQQVASAFMGEITVLLEELDHPLVGPLLRKVLLDITETSVGKEVQVDTVRFLGNPRYYNSNPGHVGLLPDATPQELTRFYSRLEAFSRYLDRYSTAAEYAAEHGTPPSNISAQQIPYLIQQSLKDLDFLLGQGRSLIEKLEEIRGVSLK